MGKKNDILKVVFIRVVYISHKNKEKHIITLFPGVNIYCLEQNETREKICWDVYKKTNICQIYLKTESNKEITKV